MRSLSKVGGARLGSAGAHATAMVTGSGCFGALDEAKWCSPQRSFGLLLTAGSADGMRRVQEACAASRCCPMPYPAALPVMCECMRFGRIGVCTLLAARCACMRACTPLCGLRAAVKASKPSHIETTFCDYDEIPTIG